jgi:RimJ/RimL family protein N-acetyltransferase
MRHEVSIRGAAFGLRPVCDADAAFIVALRGDPKLGRHLHPTPPSVPNQLAWLASYYDREDDYYFVIERLGTGEREGLIGLYNVFGGEGEWGRWVLRTTSLAAVESASLICRCAFDTLQLDAVYCRTLSTNQRVVSFHDSCGIDERRILLKHYCIRGELLDAVEHRLTRAAWPEFDARLQPLINLVARRLHRAA